MELQLPEKDLKIKLDISTQKQPEITIGIPVLNEEEHIGRVVKGFLSSSYPNIKEILIADGGSTDSTKEIIKSISEEDSRVKLIDNPGRFQSFGLNEMIEVAEGEVFLRADGHCIYQDDYVEKTVETLLKEGVRNAGGSQRYVAKNNVQAGISIAVKSLLGNGGAKYMDESYAGFADTVFLGCFWTKDLKKLKGYNTSNITNQDSELNLRLIENFGECIYVSPEVKSWYFPRDSFWTLLKQYFRYGRGRLLTKIKHPEMSPIRGLLPFIFVCFLIFYAFGDLLTPTNYFFTSFLTVLIAVLLVESLRIVIKTDRKFIEETWKGEKSPPSKLSRWGNTVISIVLMQIAHFSGFLYQLIRKSVFRVKGW